MTLPIETELIDGEWYAVPGSAEYTGRYSDGWMHCGGFDVNTTKALLTFQRLGPLAEYRPAPAEPRGLGAVVRAGNGQCWIRTNRGSATANYAWTSPIGDYETWADMVQPVKVLSEGVQL